MSGRWLLDIGIGPVGRFIAAGRRSRDLWWGSTWVSECARQTAAWLHAQGNVKLLVPSWERVREVGKKSFLDPLTYSGRVSNRLRALVQAGDTGEVAELVRRGEREARRVVARMIRESVRLLHKERDHLDHLDPREVERKTKRIRGWVDAVLDDRAFEAQLEAIEGGDDFLELFAVWTPLAPGEDFGTAFCRADELLSARKRARLFSAPAWSTVSRRKSDLDAGRDSVLRSPQERIYPKPRSGPGYGARRRLGIGPDEGLDALGLARRIAALTRGPMLEPLPFPPLGRIAADPWLEAVASDPGCDEAFSLLKEILDQEKRHPERSLFFAWCSPARDPGESFGSGETLFPFDASILFEGGLEAEEARLREVKEKGSAAQDDVDYALAVLAKLRPPILHLQARHGMPPPYYALLQMDGDGVGEALGRAATEEELQTWVRALEGFADRAAKILQDHHGCAFYVGGDDLAAYLPVDRAVEAAAALAEDFAEKVGPVFGRFGPMSLSGGIVLAHVKSDLRAVRRQAAEALAEAKKARRQRIPPGAWLEVRDVPRSGSGRSCRGPLAELATSVDLWRDLLAAGRLSLRSAQELLELVGRFADSGTSDGGSLGLELAAARIAAQQERSTKGASKALLEQLTTATSWEEIRQRAVQMLVARRLHTARRLRPTEPEEAAS